ncbi:MAG: PD-(D/E)XK nuclease family protein [Nitriliruptoraceae bacterium]
MSSALEARTPAQERLADQLLSWGGQRPRFDPSLVGRLRDAIDTAVDAPSLHHAAERARGGQLWVTKTRLDHLVCDGLAIDAEPFTNTWPSVRGILAHAAIERDWRQGRQREPSAVVAETWHDEASRRAGDPSSTSAWMNAQSASDMTAMQVELGELLESFRVVWPVVPDDHVEVQLEPPYRVPLAGGSVVMFGRPDIVLASRRRDGRARTLVVDLKTGRPRGDHDRHELRFYALLVTLATGAPPFRWATHYVTEGRYEFEDLRDATLEVTARRVIDGIRQQVRIADRASGESEGLRIEGGGWCWRCTRRSVCPASRSDDGYPEDVAGTP